MPKQNITLTEGNDAWLKDQVENVGDYANKSELINDLIRSARRAEAINKKLSLAEQSGFVKQSADEMLAEFKLEIERDVLGKANARAEQIDSGEVETVSYSSVMEKARDKIR